MGFRPAFENHSIEVCEFALAVLPAFDGQRLQRLREVCVKWSDELPALRLVPSEPLRNESIVVLAPSRHEQGLRYAYYRPNGAPVWELVIANNEIRVICTRYVSWTSAWSFAEEIFSVLLDALAELDKSSDDVTRLVMTALRYEDHFISDAPPHKFETLLRIGSPYLVPHFQNWGDVWNQEAAWFEEAEHYSSFQSYSFGTGLSGTSERDAQNIAILNHLSQIRFKEKEEPKILNWADDKGRESFASFKLMHESNKQLLTDLLTDQTLEAIGLKDDNVS